MSTPPDIAPSRADPQVLRATGDWTLEHADALLRFISAAPDKVRDIDGRDIGRLDSTGAMLLSRYAMRVGLGLSTVEVQPRYQSMVDSVRQICETPVRDTRKELGFERMLGRLGYAMEDYTREVLALIGFGGLTLQTMFRTLALDPALLFLDEPTAGLDPVGAAAFDSLILGLQRALGLTVFLITHDLDTLYTICNRVAVLADGRVLVNAPLDEVERFDHPWVQEYFHGPRGRAAQKAKERA